MDITYREILFTQFEERKSRRPSYSLRAFARDLELKSSHLTSILTHKKGLSRKAALRIAEVLEFDTAMTEYFCDLVESEHARNLKDRFAAKKRVLSNPMSMKVEDFKDFEFVLKWYYPCILELVSIHKGKITPKLCAESLQITIQEATEGISFLINNKNLSKIDDVYFRSREYVHHFSHDPNKLFREFHKQMAGLAIKKIDTTDVSKRSNLTYTMSFDAKRVDEAKEYLLQSYQQFMRKFQSTENDNSIYVLSQNFFRADQETV